MRPISSFNGTGAWRESIRVCLSDTEPRLTLTSICIAVNSSCKIWGPGRVQVVDFPEAQGPKQLCYDEEWLAVLRGTHHLFSLHTRPRPLPGAPLPH